MAISDEITRLQKAKEDIKTSIVNKGVGVEEAAKIDTYNTLIDQIAMDTTATENDILLNKTAYINGTKVTGKAFSVQTSAAAGQILNGYTAYNNAGELLTGTALSTATTATAANILSGKTAYKNDGTLLTGSMADYTGTTKTGTLYASGINSVRVYVPSAGYYDTTSIIRVYSYNFLESGSFTTTWDTSIELGPFDFSPVTIYICRNTTEDVSQPVNERGAILSIYGDVAEDNVCTALAILATSSDSTSFHGGSVTDAPRVVVDYGGSAVSATIESASEGYYLTLSQHLSKFNAQFKGDYEYIVTAW